MAVVSLLAIVPAAVPLPAQAPSIAPADLNDRGAFEIQVSGKNVGSETFEIRASSDQIQAQGEGRLQVEQNGKRIEIRTSSTLLLDPALEPISYTWNQKGTQASQLSIDFRTSPAQIHFKTLDGQDGRRDVKLDKDVLILDDNAIHHYQLALARYNRAQGGVQAFRAFIPQETLPGVITLKFEGDEPAPVGGTQRKLRHMLLTTDNAQISLWLDDRGHLQIVDAPDAQFRAVRKK